MKVRRAPELVVKLPPDPGAFAEVTAYLGKAGINIEGYTVQATGEGQVARLITDHPADARAALSRAGLLVRERQAIVAVVSHRPGELAAVTERLVAAGLQVEAAYVTLGNSGSEPYCAFAVDEPDAGERLLRG